MRDFKTIQKILGNLPDIKKVYLIGSTGAGKTSLVQNIIGTTNFSFPATSQKRTTVAPTEYVIKNNLPYKTTIILKTKEDIILSLEELIQEAIKKSTNELSCLDDIIFEFEQSSDERFKLKHIVPIEILKEQSIFLLDNITPILKNIDIDNEEIFSNNEVKEHINTIKNNLLSEIEKSFNNAYGESNYTLFSDKPLKIEGISNKDDFILKNKKLLQNEQGSIYALVEYIRIEGNLLADWLDKKLEFVLIDGEGIGHSYGEKRDILSTRHYDYFDFCNKVFLVGDAEEAFATGGQSAIESIFLNGYQDKFELIFSKTDKIEQSDLNGYLRRNLNNLKKALSNEKISFSLENKDTFKLSELNNENINNTSKREIKKLLSRIDDEKTNDIIPLDYDFDSFFSNLNTEHFNNSFETIINNEHWATIKAFSKRIYNKEIEYRHIKPISLILTFIMRDINLFLKRDDELSSTICDSQNSIKQKFSKKLISFIYYEFIYEKNHLWQQAYEKSGIGSHKERKSFILNKILLPFISKNKNSKDFLDFKIKIKQLLLDSGATERKKAIRTLITNVKIKKIFGKKNIEWSLDDDINILIGKNGCGKSTILKLIYACLKNDNDILDYYGRPYIELTISKEYDNGEKLTSTITSSKLSIDINVELINTFDSKSDISNHNISYLDEKLKKLTDNLWKYQRNLNQTIKNKTEKYTLISNKILEDISNAQPEDLEKFKELTIKTNNIIENENKPLLDFKNLIDNYFSYTEKEIIIDDEKEPLLISLLNNDNIEKINTDKLSSGEKQLLIIFLTVLLQDNNSYILLMDEPETSLHVEWQSTFIDTIKSLNSNIQIIAATHNPLMLLNREKNEISSIEINNEKIQTASNDTKYLDISSILLNNFKLSSLIGKDMQEDIKNYIELKIKTEPLNETEKNEMQYLNDKLENSFAGDIIYNEKYFSFLKFIKENKGIDFEKYDDINEDDMSDFLNDFKGLFND